MTIYTGDVNPAKALYDYWANSLKTAGADFASTRDYSSSYPYASDWTSAPAAPVGAVIAAGLERSPGGHNTIVYGHYTGGVWRQSITELFSLSSEGEFLVIYQTRHSERDFLVRGSFLCYTAVASRYAWYVDPKHGHTWYGQRRKLDNPASRVGYIHESLLRHVGTIWWRLERREDEWDIVPSFMAVPHMAQPAIDYNTHIRDKRYRLALPRRYRKPAVLLDNNVALEEDEAITRIVGMLKASEPARTVKPLARPRLIEAPERL